MSTALGHGDIEALVRAAAHQRGLQDVTDLEVEATYSTLRTSFGLRALTLAQAALKRDEDVVVERFCSDSGFDFEELPREVLVHQLDAGNGLGMDVCRAVVATIEQALEAKLHSQEVVEVDGLGEISRFRTGLCLRLDKELKVVRARRTSGTQQIVAAAC